MSQSTPSQPSRKKENVMCFFIFDCDTERDCPVIYVSFALHHTILVWLAGSCWVSNEETDADIRKVLRTLIFERVTMELTAFAQFTMKFQMIAPPEWKPLVWIDVLPDGKIFVLAPNISVA